AEVCGALSSAPPSAPNAVLRDPFCPERCVPRPLLPRTLSFAPILGILPCNSALGVRGAAECSVRGSAGRAKPGSHRGNRRRDAGRAAESSVRGRGGGLVSGRKI